MPNKRDINPLLPFTYADLLYMMGVYKKTGSGVVGSNTGVRCNRRVNAGCTLNSNSSVPAPDKGREQSVDLRELKALEIAGRQRIVFENGVWLVPSQSSAAKYRVTLNPLS